MAELSASDNRELAALVGGAGGGGHLILADWLEEKLGLGDLADALRASGDDPRRLKADPENTEFSGFRWRQLGNNVVLYMARYRVARPARRGKKPQDLGGLVLGLYLGPGAPGGPRRLSRWLPSEATTEPVRRLWDDLGKGVPVEEKKG